MSETKKPAAHKSCFYWERGLWIANYFENFFCQGKLAIDYSLKYSSKNLLNSYAKLRRSDKYKERHAFVVFA